MKKKLRNKIFFQRDDKNPICFPDNRRSKLTRLGLSQAWAWAQARQNRAWAQAWSRLINVNQCYQVRIRLSFFPSTPFPTHRSFASQMALLGFFCDSSLFCLPQDKSNTLQHVTKGIVWEKEKERNEEEEEEELKKIGWHLNPRTLSPKLSSLSTWPRHPT